jgi:hypothetical protein
MRAPMRLIPGFIREQFSNLPQIQFRRTSSYLWDVLSGPYKTDSDARFDRVAARPHHNWHSGCHPLHRDGMGGGVDQDKINFLAYQLLRPGHRWFAIFRGRRYEHVVAPLLPSGRP